MHKMHKMQFILKSFVLVLKSSILPLPRLLKSFVLVLNLFVFCFKIIVCLVAIRVRVRVRVRFRVRVIRSSFAFWRLTVLIKS